MEKVIMLGALVGDIIGSSYEFCSTKKTDFELFEEGCRFTDDSVMTLAVAKWLITDKKHTTKKLIKCMQELGQKHPYAGYGGDLREIKDRFLDSLELENCRYEKYEDK